MTNCYRFLGKNRRPGNPDRSSSRSASAEMKFAQSALSDVHVNMTISLAFLAPNLVKAGVEGRLPRGIGVERLRDAPAEWSRQFENLGLNPQ
jgi:site-specific DNA recombinase